jgi:predicted TIM-barrel fold metal-dependent hydrolase
VFEHVFMDVGLVTHNAGALSESIVRESLELVPFGKMLYSSDAFGLAELYHLGALLFRRALGRVLDALVQAGEATRADADRISTLIGGENARRVYRLADVSP